MRLGASARVGLAGALVASVAMGVSAGAALAAFPGADGRIVYGYGGNHTTLYTIEPDGSARRLIFRSRCPDCPTHAGRSPQPAVSPDGRRVVFVWNYKLEVIGIGGGRPRQITPGLPREIASDPTWAPDGRTIAYIHTRPNREEQLWVVRADGSRRHVLLKRPFTLPPIRWSPAGESILIQAGSGYGMFSLRTHRIRVFPNVWGIRAFDFSPDGKHVVFDCVCVAPAGQEAELGLMPAAGSAHPVIAVGGDTQNEFDPIWSPSGTQFLVRARNSDQSLRIIGLDGTVRKVLPVTDKATYDWQAVPTGKPPAPVEGPGMTAQPVGIGCGSAASAGVTDVSGTRLYPYYPARRFEVHCGTGFDQYRISTPDGVVIGDVKVQAGPPLESCRPESITTLRCGIGGTSYTDATFAMQLAGGDIGKQYTIELFRSGGLIEVFKVSLVF
jgi:WD40-like Beta Propeller Repeat